MDAFYSSVEQRRLHPQHIGTPVCVGPDPKKGHDRGVVRAASYEARAYGIRSGMSVLKAYSLCPEAVFLSSGFSHYYEASDEVMKILKHFADGNRIRQTSIDDAYLDVTERVRQFSSPRDLAVTIQQRILEETKLPCSIGIGPNMSVAKIAANMEKPMGITLVPQDPAAVLQFLAPLDVNVINGVGKVTAQYLHKFGISTLGQIQKMTLAELRPIMGKGSKWLMNRARGIDIRPVISDGKRMRKSIGKDRTFRKDVKPTSEEILQETLQDLCTRIGKKLREKAFHFRTVTIKIRYSDYSTIQRSKTLLTSTNDQDMLYRTAYQLLEEKRNPERSLRLLGVRVTNLSSIKGQAMLSDYF
jgi:DNA polymerase IV (DinB-like DNA polymerase)